MSLFWNLIHVFDASATTRISNDQALVFASLLRAFKPRVRVPLDGHFCLFPPWYSITHQFAAGDCLEWFVLPV